MAQQCALTTVDNPFDPFEDFNSWFLFDMEKGYDCCGRLMRFAKVTDDMTQSEENKELERAIDRIVELDFLNIYKKVTKQS